MKSSSKEYMVIFVRKDLLAIQKVVQSIHAAVESAKCYMEKSSTHPSLVLLSVDDENELRFVKDYYQSNGFQTKGFIEPHYDDSLTAFSVFPVKESEKEKFSHFKLLSV